MNWTDMLISRTLPGVGQNVPAAVSGTNPSIAAEDKRLYLCGELSSLTVSALPASGLFETVFVSGSTATQVIFPNNVLFPEGTSIEADTIYDISVRVCSAGGATYGLAAVQGWPVPSI